MSHVLPSELAHCGEPIVLHDARVVGAPSSGARRGADLRTLRTIPSASILIEDGRISAIAEHPTGLCDRVSAHRRIACAGRVLIPAFVDCHTHALWSGSRIDEWEHRLRGTSYLDILKSGGGIMSTVRSVRSQSQADLRSLLTHRVTNWFSSQGTTTLEVKSGYGLSTPDELKMLRAVCEVRSMLDDSSTVLPTALIAHALDPDVPAADFLRRTIDETLPAVHAEFPTIPIDAYCETGAWPLHATVELFERATALGHPLRVHADQFNSLGMIREAIRLKAASVDHLEASTDVDLDLLAASETFGVILPICGMHLDNRYARARRFVDSGGALALATNCNPGSAPSASMPLAIALAVRHCGLTPNEAINACTVNAAALLGLADRGYIAPGARADLVLLHHSDERNLAYELGGNPVACVIAHGKVLPRA